MCKKNNEKKGKSIPSCCCDGMTEMMRGCFHDDTDYSVCFPWMNKNWRKFCGQTTDGAAKDENRSCYGQSAVNEMNS